ncbi:DUF2306 domain-containing protein [Agrobacterium sp. NPDC089420]|uniref:DUF2306 domain-containing protein n=1 Tax=Agrobacterium sp. NPDC089420 TaxID=3363918 RepID=UPI0038507793
MFLQPLLEAPFAVQLHVATVVPAAILGAVILFFPKGTPRHRLLGRVWVVLMIVTSFSTFFIHELNVFHGFSPIHILSTFTIYGCLQSVYLARRGQIRHHMRIMQGIYLGGIVIAGGFTFLPGRIMHAVVFGNGPADFTTLSVMGTIFVFLFLTVLRLRRRPA